MIRTMKYAAVAWCIIVLTILCRCGEETCLTNGDPDWAETIDSWPIWSPADSLRIAYTHYAVSWEEYKELGDRSVWSLDLETGDREFITRGSAKDWLPDGDHIVVRHSGRIWMLDVAAGEQVLLVDCSDMCSRPRCAPDGYRISYVVDSGGDRGTWVLNLQSWLRSWISRKAATDWSPDGQSLVCDSLVVLTDSGDRVGKIPYTHERGYALNPTWSPNGQTIAFSAGLKVCVVDYDGTEEKVLADPGIGPSWSPDGRKIAFAAPSANGEGVFIWTMNSDGTGKRQVTFP